MTQPQAAREVWRGLACTRITLPNGDSVRVSDFGAQVLSWRSRGHERMFCSERAVVDGSAAIRGGVPVCFPQFNARGPLPKHGLARRTTWQYQSAEVQGEAITARWQWDAAAPLHTDFPHALRAELAVTLSADQLQITLSATNTGDTAFAFTGALHSYLAVQGADIAALHGLDGAAFWDAAKALHRPSNLALWHWVKRWTASMPALRSRWSCVMPQVRCASARTAHGRKPWSGTPVLPCAPVSVICSLRTGCACCA